MHGAKAQGLLVDKWVSTPDRMLLASGRERDAGWIETGGRRRASCSAASIALRAPSSRRLTTFLRRSLRHWRLLVCSCGGLTAGEGVLRRGS